jgi:hypothetical protein
MYVIHVRVYSDRDANVDLLMLIVKIYVRYRCFSTYRCIFVVVRNSCINCIYLLQAMLRYGNDDDGGYCNICIL